MNEADVLIFLGSAILLLVVLPLLWTPGARPAVWVCTLTSAGLLFLAMASYLLEIWSLFAMQMSAAFFWTLVALRKTEDNENRYWL